MLEHIDGLLIELEEGLEREVRNGNCSARWELSVKLMKQSWGVLLAS